MKVLKNVSNNKFPYKVNINQRDFYILKKKKKFFLLDLTCPHQGAQVELKNDGFVCPLHFWRFDQDGLCQSAKNKNLKKIELEYKNNDLFLQDKNLLRYEKSINLFKGNEDITINNHCHACVEIIYKNFSILKDPWISGPAFMGSWIQYPPPQIKVKDLNPNVIIISHEHSDHFHLETLKKFKKDIAIYFPAFPNRRIETILKDNGFKNLFPSYFGEKIIIKKNIKITFFEPVSLWNDSIVFLNINNFTILNYNDSGVNYEIKKYLPEKINLAMGQFSPGASGFPLCSNHLTLKEKKIFYKNSKKGILKVIEKAIDFYNCEHFLPFASFFMLWHPQHQEYRKNIGINSILDLENNISPDYKKKIISLLPGESFNFKTNYKKRYTHAQRKELYIKNNIEKHIKETFSLNTFNYFHKPEKNLNLKTVFNYFENLNLLPEVLNCEDINVHFFVTKDLKNEKVVNKFFIKIKNGNLKIIPEIDEKVDLDFFIPKNILAQIIKNNTSWDEAHIGYWCKFNQLHKIYEFSFWRLLQAPYFKKYLVTLPSKIKKIIDFDTSLEKILEIKNSKRVLARYGLYCFSCLKFYQESFQTATKYHGLDEVKTKNLLNELNQLNKSR